MERKNAGYYIIKSISFQNEEYVLGVKTNEKGENKYVTWNCVDKENYYYGHYIDDYRNALIDLYERAQNHIRWELEHLEVQ